MLTSTAAWMVAKNGTCGICSFTSNGGVNQHVSNAAISAICYERAVRKDPPDLWVVVKDLEVVKYDSLGFFIEGVVCKYQWYPPNLAVFLSVAIGGVVPVDAAYFPQIFTEQVRAIALLLKEATHLLRFRTWSMQR